MTTRATHHTAAWVPPSTLGRENERKRLQQDPGARAPKLSKVLLVDSDFSDGSSIERGFETFLGAIQSEAGGGAHSLLSPPP